MVFRNRNPFGWGQWGKSDSVNDRNELKEFCCSKNSIIDSRSLDTAGEILRINGVLPEHDGTLLLRKRVNATEEAWVITTLAKKRL